MTLASTSSRGKWARDGNWAVNIPRAGPLLVLQRSSGLLGQPPACLAVCRWAFAQPLCAIGGDEGAHITEHGELTLRRCRSTWCTENATSVQSQTSWIKTRDLGSSQVWPCSQGSPGSGAADTRLTSTLAGSLGQERGTHSWGRGAWREAGEGGRVAGGTKPLSTLSAHGGGGLGWGCRRLGAQGGVTAGRASSRRSDLVLVSGSGVSGRKGHPFVPSTEGHEAPTGPAEVSSAPVGPGADRRHLALIIPVSQGLPSRVQAGVRGGREASMRPAGGGGRPRAAGCN